MKKALLSVVISTFLLFLWGGLSQMLPWGISTAHNINAQTKLSKMYDVPRVVKVQPHQLTTKAFDDTFNGKVSTYVTDNTFSWIVTQPLRTSYVVYFVRELLNQLLVSVLLVLILVLTMSLEFKKRLLLMALFALCAVCGTYGQLMNWWGLPAGYGVGVAFNLFVGWMGVALVLARWLLPSRPTPDS